MTTPTDKQMVRMAGWPAGIDNRSPEQALQRDDQGRTVIALRDAENVDLDKSGKPSRRAGATRRIIGTRVHSLWGDPAFPLALYADNGALMAVQSNLRTFQVRDGLAPGQPLSYAVAAGRAYWSNGMDTGCVSADGVALAWGIAGPGGQPTLTGGSGIGGLNAGTYQVAVTFLSAAGEESGASLAATVTVPQGGGITVTDIPQPADLTQRVRIYLSPANGDVLYHVMDLPAGTTQMLLGVAQPKKPLTTQFLEVMPAGQSVRYYAGRLWVAAGKVLVYSEPQRYGQTRLPQNRITLPDWIDMAEPVGNGEDGGGLYVAAGERTYWLGGTEPAQMNAAYRYPMGGGVVPGTPVRVNGSMFGLQTSDPVIYWLARNGVACLGLPGGVVVPLREGQVIAPSADGGASLFMDDGSNRKIITALMGASQRGAAIGDKLDCEVIRHDQ